MQRFILATTLLFLFRLAYSQLAVTPGYLSMPSTINPAYLGTNITEGISMSIMSKKSTLNRFPNQLNLEDIIGYRGFYSDYRRNEIPIATSSKNIYFLGYHKTLKMGERIGFTLGTQAQIRKDEDLKLTTPQTFGFTTNVHFLLKQKRNKKRYFSNGLQLYLHHFQANKQVVDILYNQFLSLQEISLEEATAQISNIGYSLSYNVNFHSHRIDDKAFTLGASFSTTKEQIVDSTISGENGLFFSPYRHVGIKSFVSFQKVVNSQFSLELMGNIGDTFSANFGTGFRVNQKSVFRLFAGVSGDYNDGYANLMLSLDNGKYKFYALLAVVPYNEDTIFQISASYDLNNTNLPTLLRLI